MAAFVVRRLLSGLLLVALLSFVTFFVFNEIPTNPACLVVACGPHTTTTDAQIREADHELGIDRSVFVQWGDFAWHLVRDGDFGSSWTTKDHVGSMMADALPVTASLVGGGMVLMLLLALPLGSLAATRPRTPLDRGLLAVTIVGLAIHPFVLGITLRDFFATHLHVFSMYCPLTGGQPPSPSAFAFAPPQCGGVLDWAGHLAVPWLVFALLFLPLYMRMIRVRLLETFSEPFIGTARAKGAGEARVLARHALRPACGPLLPMLAIDAGTAVTAAIYVETVFGLQGFGSLAVRALSGSAGGYDLPLIAGIVTVVGAFVVVLNLAADVAGAWLDPRTRGRSVAGLVPLPKAVASRPRARLALNVAAAAIIAALLALAVLHPASSKTGRVVLGSPIRVLDTGWEDYSQLYAQVNDPRTRTLVTEHGYLELKATSIEIGPKGWRVHATVANQSPLDLRVLAIFPPGTPATYPQVPFSLVVQTDNGSGTRYLQPLPAREFEPAFPQILKAHTSWRGTFAGNGPIKKGALFYVGYGQFNYLSPTTPLPISVTSKKSANA
jgi:peptide/nickel transport system permease protein